MHKMGGEKKKMCSILIYYYEKSKIYILNWLIIGLLKIKNLKRLKC